MDDSEIQNEYPDVIFLAEAFTRPKMMKALCERRIYPVLHLFHLAEQQVGSDGVLTELTQTEMKYYFRANFFPIPRISCRSFCRLAAALVL